MKPIFLKMGKMKGLRSNSWDIVTFLILVLIIVSVGCIEKSEKLSSALNVTNADN